MNNKILNAFNTLQNKKKNNNNNSSSSSSSKIREIIKYINNNKKNLEKYNFLILLTDDYLKKKIFIFPSKKYYIKRLKLPGKLIIEKYSNLTKNQSKFIFDCNPIPNKLYIKLPKEEIYVLYSEFEYKLLESQFNEFYDILALIGAKYIKMSKLIKKYENNSLDLSNEIGLNSLCENINISNKVTIKNEKDTELLLTQEMYFNNQNDPKINNLINNNYYYLQNQIDLQNLIIRRIENNQIHDKFTYIYKENKLLNKKILTQLNKINCLSYDFSYSQISKFQIEYIIEFYNINNLNNLNIDDYDEIPWLNKMINKFLYQFYN